MRTLNVPRTKDLAFRSSWVRKVSKRTSLNEGSLDRYQEKVEARAVETKKKKKSASVKKCRGIHDKPQHKRVTEREREREREIASRPDIKRAAANYRLGKG